MQSRNLMHDSDHAYVDAIDLIPDCLDILREIETVSFKWFR